MTIKNRVHAMFTFDHTKFHIIRMLNMIYKVLQDNPSHSKIATKKVIETFNVDERVTAGLCNSKIL
jgi:hypothetical protein